MKVEGLSKLTQRPSLEWQILEALYRKVPCRHCFLILAMLTGPSLSPLIELLLGLFLP